MTPRPGRLTRLAATAVLLGVLASACASGSDDQRTDSSAAQATTPAAGAPSSPTSTSAASATTVPDSDAGTAATAPVPAALQFSAPLVGGGEFTGADYAGKPTVFWFWAPT